eukprot:1195797-Prorocentrum_minimum.AAC.5
MDASMCLCDARLLKCQLDAMLARNGRSSEAKGAGGDFNSMKDAHVALLLKEIEFDQLSSPSKAATPNASGRAAWAG